MPEEDQPAEPADTADLSDAGLSRRRLLATTGAAGAGAAALLGSGYLGYRLGARSVDPSAVERGPQVPGARRFYSRNDLSPPEVEIFRHRTSSNSRGQGPAEGYVFLAPREAPKSEPPRPQRGAMIVDRSAELVWFSPAESGTHIHDFRAQTYRGEPVLTWWEGGVVVGHGQGKGVIADTGYRRIATVEAVGDVEADLHEFLLTDRDTAYLAIYRKSRADLSELGAQRDREIYSGVVQEVDVATGELLFEWEGLDHVPLTGTGIKPDPDNDAPFDYFHLNSIFEMDESNLLISARNTHAVYSVSRRTGEINWTLGGKDSDFELSDADRFYFQHDASMISPNRLLIFDNAAEPERGPQSRAIVVQLDRQAMTAEVIESYTHPTGLLANYLGNAQRLSNGNVLVGWGAEPYFSEYTDDGRLTFDGRLPENMQSYRITAHDWTGRPTESPAIAIGGTKARGVTVYASWNGATDVVEWQVYAGDRADDLTPKVNAARTRFETAIPVNSTGPFFQAAALDSEGQELARSPVREAEF